MRNPLSRDVPKAAAAVIVALALVAGVVTGREPARTSEVAAPARAPATLAPAPVEEIDLKRLSRLRSDREVQDLFAPPASKVAPAPVAPPSSAVAAAAAPEPPPAPTAPPLPFSYLGRMTRGEQIIVYLLRNQELLVAEAGTALDDTYRLDSVSDTSVQFVYVPLGTKQSLAVPAAP